MTKEEQYAFINNINTMVDGLDAHARNMLRNPGGFTKGELPAMRETRQHLLAAVASIARIPIKSTSKGRASAKR